MPTTMRATLLVFAALLFAAPASGQTLTSIDETTLAESLPSRLDTIARRVSEGQQRLNFVPARLSVPALAGAIDRRDPVGAFEVVRTQFSYDPYEGAMRGARGALFSAGGNAFDRALLLGAILEELGYDWRLVTGELTDEQAIELLSSASEPGAWRGLDVPDTVRAWRPATDTRHRTAARSHAWVQARVGGEWMDLDPTWPGIEAGERIIEPARTFDNGDLPDAFVQQVEMRIYYSTSGTDGGQVLRYEDRVSDLGYRNLTLRMRRVRDGYIPELEVVGETIEGTIIRDGGIERVWMEIFFRLGNVEDRIERDLYRADSQVDLFQVDDSVYSLVMLPGFVGPDYYRAVLFAFLDELAGGAGSASSAAGAVEPNAIDSEPGTAVSGVLETTLPIALGLSSLTFAHVSDEVALQMGARLGVRPFYDRPRVLMTGAFRSRDQLSYQMDLRQNAIDVLPLDGVPRTAAQALQAFRGRFDSQLEGTVLAAMTGVPALTTDEVIERAGDVSLRTIHLGNVSRLPETSYSPEAQARIADDVSGAGHVCITTPNPVDVGGLGLTAWWRLEPATGALLGVSETGAHEGLAALTGQPEPSSDAAVNAPLFLMDRIATLLDGVTTTSLGVATREVTFDRVICDARCDLPEIAAGSCGGDAPLGRCLRGTTNSSSDILQMSANCASLVEPLMCGATAMSAVMDGAVTIDTAAEPSGGPWGRSLPALSTAACVCR